MMLFEYIEPLDSYAFVLASDAQDPVRETNLRALPAVERLRTGSNVKKVASTVAAA
jgi:hypothetical protein